MAVASLDSCSCLVSRPKVGLRRGTWRLSEGTGRGREVGLATGRRGRVGRLRY